MELGMFSMPSHPPERDLKEGWEFDLQTLIWGDEYGFSEAWVGEHYAAKWEPHPAPDLLVMAGLRATKNIRIGPGGFLLPYYHPAALANRVAMMDQLSDGRLNFGIAASGLPSDWEMFGIDGFGGENREMTAEAIDMIMSMWTEEPGWKKEGKYWTSSVPNGMPDLELVQHIKPLQQPHPPIGVAGLSSPSPTLELAGENGWLPMSLNLNPGYVKSHWDSYEAGAKRGGHKVSRSQWRMVREIFVADTDEEAYEMTVNGMMGRMTREYWFPLLSAFEFNDFIKADPSHKDEDLTPEYQAEHNWIIGSVDTVVEKIEKIYADVGGFGHLLLFGFDYADNPEQWRRSMELLGTEVKPRLAHLTGE